jgi:palmitoyltransferase ZDHHC13/17
MSSSETNGSITTKAEDNVELKTMAVSQPGLSPEQDIMHLARLGDIGAIQKLFDTNKYDAKYADEQGITPLHVSLRHPHSPFLLRRKLT